jgi:hypothetical protein
MIDVAVINAGVVWYSLKGQTASGRTRQWRMELLMALVAEGNDAYPQDANLTLVGEIYFP